MSTRALDEYKTPSPAPQLERCLDTLLRRKDFRHLNKGDCLEFLTGAIERAERARQDFRISEDSPFDGSVHINCDGRVFISYKDQKKEDRHVLGNGTFKKVKLCWDLFGEQNVARAAAFPREDSKDLFLTEKEIAVMEKLAGEGIQPVLSTAEFIDKKDRDRIAIFLPLARMSLHSAFKYEISIDVQYSIVHQLLSTLARISRIGSHGDIKPGNILLGYENEAFLSDFGAFADRDADDVKPAQRRGTNAYLSPDYLLAEEPTAETREKHDVWALGLTLCELFSGESPLWIKEKSKVVLKTIITGLQPGWQEGIPFPEDCKIKPLILAMLEIDPAKRPTAAEALAMFEKLNTQSNFSQR